MIGIFGRLHGWTEGTRHGPCTSYRISLGADSGRVEAHVPAPCLLGEGIPARRCAVQILFPRVAIHGATASFGKFEDCREGAGAGPALMGLRDRLHS